MLRKTKLDELEVTIGQVLLKELELLTSNLEATDVNYEQLGEMVDEMEKIKSKIRKHIVQHKQWEVMDQYLKFDEIIKNVRDLQNKRDVTSM